MLCQGSVRKLATGACLEPGVTAVGAERGQERAGERERERAGTWEPYTASRIKFH